MPKQIHKIDQFHGGLNSNSDPRDIAPNELSAATDVMVDELGKIRTMGGTAQHYNYTNGANNPNKSTAITPGYGLFQFSHDRTEGDSAGDTSPETGDDYLAMVDATNKNVDIYSRVTNLWGTGKITLGTTAAAKAAFYYADGALRVSDGNFGDNNETQWYGYIYRRFFGDGTTGYDDGTAGSGASYENGLLVTKWHTEDAAPKALALKSVFGHIAGSTPDEDSPIAVDVDAVGLDYKDLYDGTDSVFNSDTDSASIYVTFSASSPNVTVVNTGGGSLTPGLDTFCNVGDKILIEESNSGENDQIFTVSAVSTNSTSPNTMDFEETVAARVGDAVVMYNLSRSFWFDPINTGWQIAVSTLYDDSKQESALDISSTTLQPSDILGWTTTSKGYTKFKIDFHVWAGVTDSADSQGLPYDHPRVSGFKIYMRREDTSVWYLQAEIDMTKGNKWFQRGDYAMWYAGEELTDCAHADGEYLIEPRQIETYEDETGYDSTAGTIGFDGIDTGFKTAVVANRIVYAGHPRIKDWKGDIQTYGDAILKSGVGKFDSFTLERRLETDIRDGDEIVKLEEYADRILIFKKKKMQLLNISQELEILEDTFKHKGVAHPAATCKTDYGIAWVNKLGCYLYDGKQVVNLLEKQGRQIIKESDWATFTANEPMIGYIPKKRQLIVVDDITTNGEGATFLYDMVTQSWVKGSDDTIDDQKKTNFVTDWNGDLIHAHSSSGTVLKWVDASAASAGLSFVTKDIDFGQPGQRKKISRVYITYKGASDTNVDVFFDIDGGTSLDKTFQNGTNFSSNQLAGSSTWAVAELKPTTSSEANNKKSFRLKFVANGTVPTTFEINDISIVYRLKPVK